MRNLIDLRITMAKLMSTKCVAGKVDDLLCLSFIQYKSAEIACSLEGYFIKVGIMSVFLLKTLN